MIVEQAQTKRLKEKGINIKTKYKVGEEVREKNTDNSKNDQITSGIILEKDYYKGVLLKKETIFDSRMLYTYELNMGQTVICNNCGMTSTLEEFNDACPYCHSAFNVDYENKELGSKHYFDWVVKNKSYIIKTYILDFLVSLVITAFIILPNSRTFYIFDILKVVIGAILISLILFYVFYYVDASILLPWIKAKKEKQNQKQRDFWNRMNSYNIDKIKFFNNLNYELREYYYGEKNQDIIDFDILDYTNFEEFQKEENFYIKVTIDIRLVRYGNNKITSKEEEKTYTLKRVKEFQELQGGINQIACPSCGASIDRSKPNCSYCGKQINHFQEWYLEI